MRTVTSEAYIIDLQKGKEAGIARSTEKHDFYFPDDYQPVGDLGLIVSDGESMFMEPIQIEFKQKGMGITAVHIINKTFKDGRFSVLGENRYDAALNLVRVMKSSLNELPEIATLISEWKRVELYLKMLLKSDSF